MATVVGIMDEPHWGANTDVIVVADPRTRRLLWVPRDLWCNGLGARVNRAFAEVGTASDALRALAELGVEAQHAVCVRRDASERTLADMTVRDPVPYRIVLEDLLDPPGRIEQGRKQVIFEPPAEMLSGERIHQWIGARQPGSDLDRIQRQQVFLRSLLERGFDFGTVASGEGVSVSNRRALDELQQVDASWHFETYRPLASAVVEGAHVLLPRRPGPVAFLRHVARKLLTGIRARKP